MNVQSFVKKRLDLNFIVDDLRENTIYRSNETWSTENDDQKLWEMHPNSFKTFRSDRETPNKNCGGGYSLLLRIPKYLNPKVRKDLNLMNKNYFECLWVECNINCQNSTRQRQLINICYNPNKNVSIFLEDLSSSIDRAVTENKPITLTGDYNFDCLIEKERQYLDTILTPYGLEVIHRNEATHIQGELMSSIDYIITDHEKSSDFNSNVADTPLRTSKNKGIGHFATTLVTNFEMKKAKSVTQKKVYDK